MALLTPTAIEGYKDYTKKTIAYAQYKAGAPIIKQHSFRIRSTGR